MVILITIVFILVRAMPEEGYFSNYEKMSPQQIEVGLRKMGLKDPLYVQVGKFLYNALRGDLGISYRYRINAKITDIISSKIRRIRKRPCPAVYRAEPHFSVLGIVSCVRN